MAKCWIYHESEPAMIVDMDEAQSYYDDGWANTPAKFVKTTDFGVDPDDPLAVQALGETLEKTTAAVNGAINLDEMDKAQLIEYAGEYYSDCKVDGRMTEENIRLAIKEFLNGNGS